LAYDWIVVHAWIRAACLAAVLDPASLLAGPKVAPVSSACPADRPHRNVDVEETKDRCVARKAPACDTGLELRSDAAGEQDACVAASAGVSDKGKPPKCSGGFRLRAAAGPDACEDGGPPTCPPGFKLKATKGQDQCHH
jgi:hypothetical protein